MNLYIIFIIEVLCLTGLFWWIFRHDYFKSLFITSAVLMPLSVAGWWFVAKTNPEMLDNFVFEKVTPIWMSFLAFAVKFLPLFILAIMALYMMFFFAYRLFQKYIAPWIFKFKMRMFDKDDSQLYKKHKVNTEKYLNPETYFLGIAENKPVYVTEKDIVTHIQVVGPSGTGKTASVLLPLAAQALERSKSLVFVDGKGDSQLKTQLQKLCASKGKNMMFFDPLQPNTSHTYNPLTSSRDSDEVMNLIARGLDLNAPGEAKVYTDIQKKFLATLLHLFGDTGLKYNFIDIIEFINHQTSRDIVYGLVKDKFYIEEMNVFLSRLSKNEKELIGLSTVIDQLFVSDKSISGIINTYSPDIDIKTVLGFNAAVLFSFSAGKKAATNEALAKMVLADIFNSVGERHGKNDAHDFAMIILDEFGQYVTESFDKFISTARSANIGCVLSHQTNAQLEVKSGDDKLARVVRENTAMKMIFRQAEEASFWSECFGTKSAMKRTEQVETTRFLTEKISTMGSLREVDEFLIHPNRLRQLEVGQAVFKFKELPPVVISTGLYPVPDINVGVRELEHSDGDGLNLRRKRLAFYKQESQRKEIQIEAGNQENKKDVIFQ